MDNSRRRPMSLDDKFQAGPHKGQHLWAVIKQDRSYVDRLIDQGDLEVDNDAYASLKGIHTGTGAVSASRREVRL